MIDQCETAFFIFLYFSKSFFTEIYFRFQNLQVYNTTPGRGPPARRPPAAPCRVVGAYMQLKFMFYRMEAPTARQGAVGASMR